MKQFFLSLNRITFYISQQKKCYTVAVTFVYKKIFYFFISNPIEGTLLYSLNFLINLFQNLQIFQFEHCILHI